MSESAETKLSVNLGGLRELFGLDWVHNPRDAEFIPGCNRHCDGISL